jgi:Aspartyl protease/PDZ domain
MVVIRAAWNGKPADFVFDTGCTTSVLDLTAFPSLVKATDSIAYDTPAGEMTQALFQPPQLNIGPFRLEDAGPVVRSDLSPVRDLLGRPIVGLLGKNLCNKLVVQIDFDNTEIRFFKPDDRSHPEWGNAVPIETAQTDDGPDSQNVLVRVIIGRFEDLFIVDTGDAGTGNIPIDGFDDISHATSRPVARIFSYTLKGIAPQRYMRAPDFSLGDQHYHDLIFGEDAQWQGRLGFGFLSRHLVTFDFPHSRLYLKPGKAFNRHEEWTKSGLAFDPSAKPIVLTVDANSPAYIAGLRDGDVLVQIDGKDAASFKLSDATHRSEEKTHMNVHVLHNGVPHSVTFKLRHWF